MRKLIAFSLVLAACRDHDHHGDDGAETGGSSSEGSTGLASATEGSSGEASSGSTGEPDESAVDEARRLLPTYLDLHDVVISRTCTPNQGVCHNDKEYPDLHTPQALLAAVGLPCNLVVKDVRDTFDGCEQKGDTLTFMYSSNEGFASEIAWIELDDGGDGYVITLRDEIPLAMYQPDVGDSFELSRTYDDGDAPLVDFYQAAWYTAGEREVIVPLSAIADYDVYGLEILDEVRGGDPNRNGTFGAESPGFAMIVAGDPSSSYLLGRVQATVPGTPMPLANQPLSSSEMLALTCWIEGLGDPDAVSVDAAIDYDDCEAALAFGQPDPDSGHGFAAAVQPIFTQYCTGSGCHGGDAPAQNLDLTEGHAYASLSRAAGQDPSTPLVEPGNPTNSYLMIKLWSKGIAGFQMPRGPAGEGTPLPAEQLDTLERWIVAGAPND